MENPEQYYDISRYLDGEKMIAGLPAIEVIPAVIIVVLGFLIQKVAPSICVVICLVLLMRYVRRKYGKNIFYRFNYAFLSDEKMLFMRASRVLKRFPSSTIKYWRK